MVRGDIEMNEHFAIIVYLYAECRLISVFANLKIKQGNSIGTSLAGMALLSTGDKRND